MTVLTDVRVRERKGFDRIGGPRVPFRVFTLAEPSRLVVDIADGTAD